MLTELKRRNYDVQRYGGAEGFDGLIGGKATYDVKASTCQSNAFPRGGYAWQFNLSRYNRECVEHLIIGLCYADPTDDDPIAVFIIPGGFARGQRKISIPSKDPRTYSGKYARYLDGWSLIDEMLETLEDFVEFKSGDIPF